MRNSAVLASLVATAMSGVAMAQTYAGGPTSGANLDGPYLNPPLFVGADRGPSAQITAYKTFKQDMHDLYDRGNALRAQDGGTLTAEHREQLQARLNDVQRIYRNKSAFY